MKTVEFSYRVGLDAAAVFKRLTDFRSYKVYSKSVRNITVSSAQDNVITSEWEVNFKEGILRWSERDTIDSEAGTIDFAQTKGDMQEFYGRWVVSKSGNESVVLFSATFDLGIPHIADLLEPVAAKALRENIDSIVRGLTAGQAEPPGDVDSTTDGARPSLPTA